MPSLDTSISIAATRHEGQTYGDGDPYIFHPLSVMMRFETLDLQTVAVLHDVFEDTDMEFDELKALGYGDYIIDALRAITKEKGEDYFVYLKRVMRNQISTIVKLADMSINTSNLEDLKPKFKNKLIAKYGNALVILKTQVWTSSHYAELAKTFLNEIKGNLDKVGGSPAIVRSNDKIRVGLLGGAFDPITVGHIKLAEYVLDLKAVDQVWLTPCFNHNFSKDMVDADHRLAMCRIAARNFKSIGICSTEIERRMSGKTYDLINEIKKNDISNRLHDYHLIVGHDNINCFDEWYKSEELKRMINFVIVPRKGVEWDVTNHNPWWNQEPHIFLGDKTDIPEISSTEVRSNLAFAKRDDKFLSENVDSKVLDYIFKHKLYIK